MYDKRRKYYLVLDCETATLPYVNELAPEHRQTVAIAKPLVYDLGWKVIDRKGNVYARKNYLITEIFSVPHIFNTAYYASKRPIYLDKLRKKEIILADWQTATDELEKDLKACNSVGAYNSMFDFKKAIPFTEEYISALYSPNYHKWEKEQKEKIDFIIAHPRYENKKGFNGKVFSFRGNDYELFDLWGLSCKHLLDNDDFRQFCADNNYHTSSKKFFSTTAETSYRFLMNDTEFIESHTAIDDVDIETEIFKKIIEKTKNKYEKGIIYFPFRIVGRYDFFVGEIE